MRCSSLGDAAGAELGVALLPAGAVAAALHGGLPGPGGDRAHPAERPRGGGGGVGARGETPAAAGASLDRLLAAEIVVQAGQPAQRDDYYMPMLYYHMFVDPLKTGAYLRALERQVKPGMRVLDVGAGTGIFSVAAARLGAEKVWAVESRPILETGAPWPRRTASPRDRIRARRPLRPPGGGEDRRGRSGGERVHRRRDFRRGDPAQDGLDARPLSAATGPAGSSRAASTPSPFPSSATWRSTATATGSTGCGRPLRNSGSAPGRGRPHRSGRIAQRLFRSTLLASFREIEAEDFRFLGEPVRFQARIWKPAIGSSGRPTPSCRSSAAAGSTAFSSTSLPVWTVRRERSASLPLPGSSAPTGRRSSTCGMASGGWRPATPPELSIAYPGGRGFTVSLR